MPIDPQLAKALKKADLRYISDNAAGITRKRNNISFKYFDTDGKNITSEIILNRIEDLAIPPAWSNVWICPSPSGYLQAVGFDEKGRKQYIYHPEWLKISQENKFNKMVFFGEILPEIRKKVSRDMMLEELERNRIIATVVWLLEHTFIRIGNIEYAEENNSFGLTTLRNRHVKVRGKKVKFEFRGKSGVQQSVSVSHPRIAKLIKECIELPGYEIFKYLDDTGERHTIDSVDVNNYLKDLTGEDVSAKDFRTWGGTTLCATTLCEIGPFQTPVDGKRNIAYAVKKVSQHLHNTASVCRNYYIHPIVIKTYQENKLIPHFKNIYINYSREKAEIGRNEFATLTLLRKYS
ncbi:MAG: DNA topoisomerase IB [Patescibacteria group bacterium]|nr:DNA topoisomerase IB [Patescibacteria group bacterium]